MGLLIQQSILLTNKQLCKNRKQHPTVSHVSYFYRSTANSFGDTTKTTNRQFCLRLYLNVKSSCLCRLSKYKTKFKNICFEYLMKQKQNEKRQI